MKKLLLKITAFSLASILCGTSCSKNFDIAPISPSNVEIPPNIEWRPLTDLSAESISFSLVRAKDRYSGIVKIEGVIRNIGTTNFVSGPKQQVAYLYQDSGGTPLLVASQSFQNLPANGTINLSFTRDWDRSSSAEGEFPPTYILYISFSPDLYTDGNRNNDDFNLSNNRLAKSSAEINSFTFAKY